jgi:hypothetical protein
MALIIPISNDPVSPIKILAGEWLKMRNARRLPPKANARIA